MASKKLSGPSMKKGGMEAYEAGDTKRISHGDKVKSFSFHKEPVIDLKKQKSQLERAGERK